MTERTKDRKEAGAAAPALRRAALALFWERLWPRLVLAASLLGLFLALGWTGVAFLLPDAVRLAVAGLAAAAVLGGLVCVLLTPWPDRSEAIGRLEHDAGVPHRPLSALADFPADGATDPLTAALWRAHRRQLRAALSRLRAGPPSPRLDRRDPYALRALAVFAVVIGATAARDDLTTPVFAMFRLPPAAVSTARVDVWAAPPDYTGAAPRLLAAADPAAESAEPIRLPVGSRLSVRTSGLDAPSARYGGLDLAPSAAPPGAAAAAFETVAGVSGELTVMGGGDVVGRYPIEVIADEPPEIELSEQPAATPRGALHLAYEARDDYGVRAARARFALPSRPDMALPRPLYDPPTAALALPGKGSAAATTVTDLTTHPFAGGPLRLTLEAEDGAGGIGRSPAIDIILPGRTFNVPLAAALAEQRRRLASDAHMARRVADTLDTLSRYGAAEMDKAGPIIGIRVAVDRINAARSDDDLRSAADLLWSMALSIEGGEAADAGEALRQARNALREALRNGAPPEEIARLAEAAKDALETYLEAMVNAAGADPSRLSELGGQRPDITSGDMTDLLDRLKRAAELGDRKTAESLLSELDDVLDNLRPGNGAPQANGPADKALDALAGLLRRQMDLMKDTHRLTPDGRPTDGSAPDESTDGRTMESLEDLQRRLADDLDALAKGLAAQGLDGGEGIDEAGRQMRDAQGALGEGDAEGALGSEGRAVDALRKGARAMAEAAGGGTRFMRGEGRDPLGRGRQRTGPDAGEATRLPGEIEAERVRRLLDELRRRYSDPDRSPLELDYLKRLIAPFGGG